VILGAGLAGLTLSLELLQKSKKVLLIDINAPGAGASGTPAGLMNPATAQKALLPDEAKSCIQAFYRNLKRLHTLGMPDLILHEKVLRPALDQTLQQNFSSSLENPWPDNWVEWIECLPKNYPLIPNYKGGLMIHIAKAINVPKFLEGLFLLGRKLNLNYSFYSEYSHFDQLNHHGVVLGNEQIMADKIVDCTGSRLADTTDIRLHKVKGQIRSVHAPDFPTMTAALSAYGYLVQNQEELIVGSTYEHHFIDQNANSNQDIILLNKIRMMTGRSYTECDITHRWAGVRLTTPDRKPAIGALTSNLNYYYYTGLGSKGLFYSSYISQLLSEHLLSNAVIPKKFNINRFLTKKIE